MSEATNNVETTNSTPVKAAEKKTPAKKVAGKTAPAKKASAKAPAKKAAAKKPAKEAPKAERKGRVAMGPDELRAPQVAILEFLSKATSPQSRAQIAEGASVDPTKVGVYAGPRPADESATTREKFAFKGLYEHGFVKCEVVEGVRGQCYTITGTGRKALAKQA